MRKITLSLHVQKIPPVMLRGQHVLIVLQNSKGEFLLGKKNIYPNGIVRFIGGGMEAGENPLVSAQRELFEETGLQVAPQSLSPLVEILAQIHLSEETFANQPIFFNSYLFYHHLSAEEEQRIKASDDVNQIVTLNSTQSQQLIEVYEHLSEAIDPKLQFSWYDYGQLYGFIHRTAFAEVAKLKTSRKY